MASDNTRDLIIQAAGPIFAERGFARATVRDICAAAGVNVAAINYYFGDKRQLYVETVYEARARRAVEVPLPQFEPGTPAAERLRVHVSVLMGRMMGLDDGPWETRLLTQEVLNPSEACRAMVEDHFRPHFEELVEVIRELLPPDVALEVKQRFAFSLIGQCFFYRAAGNVVSLLIPANQIDQHFSVDQLAEHISDIMLGALAAYRGSPGYATSDKDG